jgi:hypothetical protein
VQATAERTVGGVRAQRGEAAKARPLLDVGGDGEARCSAAGARSSLGSRVFGVRHQGWRHRHSGRRDARR